MGKVKEEQKNKGGNRGYDNLIPFKPGESGNPNGRPKGQRNYSTIYREALEKLGSINNKTPEELETELIASGFAMAKKDYRFYKDVLDRIHGQALQKVDHTTDGEKLPSTDLDKLAEVMAEQLRQQKI